MLFILDIGRPRSRGGREKTVYHPRSLIGALLKTATLQHSSTESVGELNCGALVANSVTSRANVSG